ncbi:MAG: sensor histidine kinase, partial [Desulfobacterales bacterium]|nr:sensor histidine kinase [Desulfobacterales bacterium]
KRMTKVQARLNTLKGDIEPAIRDFSARRLLQICCDATGKKLSRLKIRIECEQDFTLPTDPDFMAVIVENLFINALEANSGGDTSVSIKIEKTDNRQAQIAFTDNGPGIATQLLPDQLFEPFITSKVNGSGIGLWQVRQLVESLNGRISAQNAEEGGARFLLFIPATPS